MSGCWCTRLRGDPSDHDALDIVDADQPVRHAVHAPCEFRGPAVVLAGLIDEWRTAAAAPSGHDGAGRRPGCHLFEFKVVEQAGSGAALA